MERNTHERPSKLDLNVNNKASNGTAAKSSTVPVSPTNGSTSSNGRVKRKQWVLHDGPHGSLQRLRLRMAEEGCGHSQVALAKQFLSENSGESDQYAIHWLMKAADQGISEGLELLKTCFDSNRGINENNFHKIRSFLDMSQNERAARLGAKTLFSTMAQGSDFVTTKQLEQWLEESLAKHTSDAASAEEPLKMETVDTSSLVVGGDLISEQHFTNAASIYSSGHFPPLLRLLDLGSKQKLSFLAHWLTHNLLNLFSHSLSLSVMFTLVIVFTVLSNSLPVLLNMQLSSLVVLLSWMLAVAAAVVCTAHTSRLVRDWNVFHGWSVLLSQHAQQLLQPAIPEQMYLARTFPPQLGRLLVSVVPCVVLQRSLVNTLALPFGELGVLACLVCSASLDCRFALGLDDLLCLIGWILWRMQSSPWKSFQDENDPETPMSPPEVFQLSFFPALSVRFHMTAVIGSIILVPLYMRRLRQFSNSTSLQFFSWSLAHFSSLVWLFLAIDWLQMSTYDGILRGLIVFVAALLLRSNCNWLTKANLMLCCVTSYSSGHSVGLSPLMALALSICLICAGRLGAQILDLTSQRHRLFEIINSSLVRRPLLYLWTAIKSALLIACLAICTIRVVKYFETHDLLADDNSATINPSMPVGGRVLNDGDSLLDSVPSTISWERYRNFCAHPSPGGATASIASTQLACSALNGVSVQWEGVVRQVSIESRKNWAEDILQWLPSKWAEWISCRVGEKWPSCHDNDHHSPQSFESKRCHLLWRINQHRGRHCHVDRFSKFTFVFEVEPNLPNATLLASLFDSKVTIMLMASPRFQSLGFRLAPGHAVRFRGVLSSPSLGGLKPQLELTSLECLTCQSSDSSSFSNSHLPKETRYNHPEPQPTEDAASWLASLATGALQGAADFVLPHFIRLNVTQLWSE